MKTFSIGYEYLESAGNKLFTIILKPSSTGKFPTVIFRNPYVDDYKNKKENEIVAEYFKEFHKWCENGFVVVAQQCRGKGKSSGEFLPFAFDREDGLNLHNWVRQQDFYDGNLFLAGGSYTSLVHWETAPFADDIKGVVSSVVDCNRYNFCYHNGFFKKALLGDWYVSQYTTQTHNKEKYDLNTSFEMLPFKKFPETVLGEPDKNLSDIIKSPYPEDEFWTTQIGGKLTNNATVDAKTPMLLITGFYDIFTAGIFAMWNKMNYENKAKSSLVVTPYDHADTYNPETSIEFKNGRLIENFGDECRIKWCKAILGKAESPFEAGKVSYYRLFENKWATDSFRSGENKIKIKLGSEVKTYKYDPDNAPRFGGGLSRNFGGSTFQNKPHLRDDIISVYTDAFDKDVFVKGNMTARLKVKSDCEDTCFFIRISITKEGGDFGLRDDITSLCYQLGDYKVNSEVYLDFNFDEHAFLIKKGEKLRVDIASADGLHFIRHTNQKGLYGEQSKTKIAENTVYLDDSFIVLPTEK